MRILMQVKMPNEKFNAAVRDGSAGAKMQKILGEQKPEAAYFMEQGGQRCAVLIVDLPDASGIPALAEPWFLTFDASVELKIIMGPADLAKAGLEALGKKWG